MKEKQTFGLHLAALIAKANISQRQLAKKSGVNFVTVNRLISGAYPESHAPEQQTVEKLANAIPCSIGDYLLLFRLARRVPRRIVERFAADEDFAARIWEASK